MEFIEGDLLRKAIRPTGLAAGNVLLLISGQFKPLIYGIFYPWLFKEIQ